MEKRIKQLTTYSYVGYGFIVAAFLGWDYYGYDERVLGLLILGCSLLLVDVVKYYKKRRLLLNN